MKKITFRIIGALASALIIVSVFVPFYTSGRSLWDIYELSKSLYLPIMIIAFGAIGTTFFSLNVKTEFAYMSSGAIIFFLIIQTIEAINNNVFNTLNAGYYFLVIGALVTAIMAFITNIKKKEPQVVEIKQGGAFDNQNIIQKIDNLYNEQFQSEVQPIQPLTPNGINPVNEIGFEKPETDNLSIVPNEANDMMKVEQVIPEPSADSSLTRNQFNELEQNKVNPVINEFEQPVSAPNPVINEFEQPVSAPNPVRNEFEQPVSAPNPVINEFEQPVSVPNPVMNQFEQPVSVPNPTVNSFEQANNSVATDIFGQPIDR